MGDIEDVGDAVPDEQNFDPDVDASGITVRIVNREVTLAGTVARVVTELVSVMAAPPAGAAAFSVTVPVAPNPPITLV